MLTKDATLASPSPLALTTILQRGVPGAVDLLEREVGDNAVDWNLPVLLASVRIHFLETRQVPTVLSERKTT